jgi:hypothetical protein
MFDDALRLRENPHLLALLSHYAQQGTEDRTTWRARLMQMDGVERSQLSTLHGELIAFDWIEQNTGQTLAACYRITLNGLREYRRIHGVEVVEEQLAAPEKSQPKFPRKKKSKMPEADVVMGSEETIVPAA